ncbi:MAG: imidazoleglycerol-phosphate dehydratase HisB [Planctomycetes bacterium]|nr:imidazoleglycerol-phosphate dehydratase HisB [Planctomycetota bacterium]
MAGRNAKETRKTKETDINLTLNLDGSGKNSIETGVGFFDHMLTLLVRHSLMDLTIEAHGDIDVDAHHTVEDVGLLLGKAIAHALGDKKGITRYGFCLLPMDEARVDVALDLSGRPRLVYTLEAGAEKVGEFDTCLAQEFFQALSNSAGINLHIEQRAGKNPHHILEAAFKAVGRALRMAVTHDPREEDIPSSKGVL